jgi:hypothetical protein
MKSFENCITSMTTFKLCGNPAEMLRPTAGGPHQPHRVRDFLIFATKASTRAWKKFVQNYPLDLSQTLLISHCHEVTVSVEDGFRMTCSIFKRARLIEWNYHRKSRRLILLVRWLPRQAPTIAEHLVQTLFARKRHASSHS